MAIGEGPLWTGNLIALYGPVFEVTNGLDVVVFTQAMGSIGLSLLVQNPYAGPLGAHFFIKRPARSLPEDRVYLTLAALEIGLLVLPLAMKPGEEVVLGWAPLAPWRASDRIRARAPASRDTLKTLARLATGAASLAILGAGRFGVVTRGGTLGLAEDLRGRLADGAQGTTVEYERIWAPPGAGPAAVQVVRRCASGYELTTVGEYVCAFGALTGGGLGSALLAGHNPGSLLPAFLAVAAGTYAASYYALRHWGIARATRRKASLLVVGNGPGVESA